MKGKVNSINISKTKGMAKDAVEKADFVEGLGIEGDAHAGPGDRQVSLLAIESITKQLECPKVKKKNITLGAGDFAENITAQGIDFSQLKIGDKLLIGIEPVILEITKIGKDCHKYCSIYYKIGDCIMPKEGVFAKVLKGGIVNSADDIEVIHND